MKARRFADQLKEAATLLTVAGRKTGDPEPTVVIRAGTDGEEVPVKTVKIRSDHKRRQSFIILEIGPHYPTEDAYLRACRALNWRTAQLRALGVEPATLPADAPQYPPDDYDWNAK